MINKICFLVDWNMYEVVRHFTKKVAEAFRRKGIKTQIIEANQQEIDPEAFQEFLHDPPDLTCSFNRIAKLSSGKNLWDFLEIPHVAFLVDPPIYYLDLTDSPYITLTSVDRSDAKALRSVFPRVIFWPHAVERELNFDPKEERPLDVVFFGSCFDYISLRKEWKEKLPSHQSWVLDIAIDIALINSSIPLSEALTTAWDAAGLSKKLGQEDFQILYHYFEKFLIGKDRFELINAIRDAEVHVFGQPFQLIKGETARPWSDYFPEKKNIVFHPPVKYSDTFEILKKSKLCLNSTPSFRDGTHERIFAGLASGALPVTSDSLYLSENFSHGEDILFYKMNHWYEVNEWVNEYLADEAKRVDAAKRGQEKVQLHHTWDVRVDQLLQELPPFLS